MPGCGARVPSGLGGGAARGGLEGAAQLDCMEGNLQVSLEFSDGQGNIEASISLTPDPLTEEHAFVFAIDQSHLPFILRGLQAVLERFPIRGTPD